MSRLAARGIAVAGLAVLAACTEPAINRGAPAPVLMSTRLVRVPYPTPAALQDAIARLGGEPSGLRVEIAAGSARRARALSSELIGMGVDPSRIALQLDPSRIALRLDPSRIAYRSRSGAMDTVVTLSRTVAVQQDCEAALQPNAALDVSDSLSALGHCVASNDLVQGLADPEDLDRPLRAEAADGPSAVRAVQRYRQGRVAQPTTQPSASSEDGTSDAASSPLVAGSPSASGDAGGSGGGSSGSSGGGSGASDGAGQSSGASSASGGQGGAVLDTGAGAGAGNPLTSSSPLAPDAASPPARAE